MSGTRPGRKKGHGPYWYGYWKTDGKLHKRYFGKNLPWDFADDVPRAEKPKRDEVPDRFAWDGRRMSIPTALRILGLGGNWTSAKAVASFRKLVMKYHPDRAKTDKKRAEWTRIMQAVNVAVSRLRD